MEIIKSHSYKSPDGTITLYVMHTRHKTYTRLVNKNTSVSTAIYPDQIDTVIKQYSLKEVQ